MTIIARSSFSSIWIHPTIASYELGGIVSPHVLDDYK